MLVDIPSQFVEIMEFDGHGGDQPEQTGPASVDTCPESFIERATTHRLEADDGTSIGSPVPTNRSPPAASRATHDLHLDLRRDSGIS